MRGELALHRGTSAATGVALIACGLSRHQRAYVADGLRLRADCSFFDSFEELDRILPTLPRCDALVLATEDQRCRGALGTVERVTRDWPGTAIVIFCPARAADRAASIRSLAVAGAHAFVFEGLSDTAAMLAQAVESSRRECVADVVFARLMPVIPTPLLSMTRAVLSRPDELTSVGAVAMAMGVHRKTLVNRSARCRFLQPAELIVWCRLAMVGHLLGQTGATVESIALTLGFASHTALRNLIKRHTGQRATDIRRQGGLGAILSALERRIASTHRAVAHIVTV